MVVASHGLYLDDLLKALHHGYVQGAAAKVNYQKLGVIFPGLVPAGQGCCRWFIDQTFHLKSGQLSGLFGCKALLVIKISRHTDDSFLHRFPQICFRIQFKLLQYEGRELGSLKYVVPKPEIVGSAHLPLKGGSAAFRLGMHLFPGNRACPQSAILIHADHAGGQECSQGIGNQLCLSVSPD